MRVFLSHSSKDKPIVRTVGRLLQAEEIDTLIDEATLPIGGILSEELIRNIESSDYIIFFLSRYAMESEWVMQEIEIARGLGEKIKAIPVILDDTPCPSPLADRIHIDGRTGEPTQIASKICQAVGNGLLPNIDNLDQFQVIDALLENSQLWLMLCYKASSIPFQNPDGSQYYQKHVFIVEIGEGKILSTVRVCRNLAVDHGCIGLNGNHILSFLNFKPPSANGDYAMCGTLYYYQKSPLKPIGAKPLFLNQNWGFYPVLEGDDVIHFSYHEYYDMRNQERIRKSNDNIASQRHVDWIAQHSGGILPNSHSLAMQRIRKFLADGKLS